MSSWIRGDRPKALIRRVDNPGALLLALIQAGIAAAGWLGPPLWLAIAAAAQLAVGGIGAVRIIGPAHIGFGFARYATPALAGLALTLFGRLLRADAALLLAPAAALLLWAVLHMELRISRGLPGSAFLDLVLTATVFTAAAGVAGLFGLLGWPPPVVLVAAMTAVLAIRAAEARGASGSDAFGQAALHALAVTQLGVAAGLLDLPMPVGPAIMALGFYAWSGAADALQAGRPERHIVLEYGTLAALGIVVALLLQRT